MNTHTVEQSALPYLLTRDRMSAVLWLIVRLYLGYGWITAGWEKFTNPAWWGPSAGAALNGFVQGALTKTGGLHPDVQMWYASFLQSSVMPHLNLWSHAVVLGELAIGLGLVVGLVTGIAAFFGFFMNLNFMLAGSVSVNPIWMVLALCLILSWRVAGYLGLDRFALPLIKKYTGRALYRTA